MYDIAIIGAGIIGTAVARELSKYDLRILLLEKNNEIANEATKANSGIVYNGHTARAEKLKGRLTLRGRQLFEPLCRELGVAFKPTDMLIVGFDDEDDEAIRELHARAVKNGIKGARLIDRDEILQREPNVNGKVRTALLNPGCGLVDPWELCLALAENAAMNGVQVMTNTEVTGLTSQADGIIVSTIDGNFACRAVISCAGVHSESINTMSGSNHFTILPKRGQYAVLDRNSDFQVSHIVAHCKSEKEKSVFLIPTVHGNVMIGPIMEPAENASARETTAAQTAKLLHSARKIAPRVPERMIIRTFAGLKAKCSLGDFLIEESQSMPGLIMAAGINNPGLTCSPAIAVHIAGMVGDLFARAGRTLEPNAAFIPGRGDMLPFSSLSDSEKNALIREHPGYGRIVCRCEAVSEEEIRDSIRRVPGARSTGGIKRRTRAGMGRCQGGFCEPRVVRLLAEELDGNMNKILMENKGSEILAEPPVHSAYGRIWDETV
ncbi:NAD(P)/FAD-dependent oxidoreductase [Paenibacillus sp. HN-1]|uniref:NAD(P)/FAD-dependent oxidoreductase n=1 Tax=Paenibacillus TaxID=44249 RepID=UPI001CA9CD97|nr:MULTISPECIES: NAD(P)/FAD-dependent oxidoreductase [Paenibacillus]MBY9081482.1 NAD(P)/FAD-dependent oxidoreductase [Paenibacillus sp. CGMCC 1.18879]MBY9085002.1 NAD(P)/FAD-dependent oxidoreductase [Paenibacillus sinensis]